MIERVLRGLETAHGTLNLNKRELLEFFDMEKWKGVELVKSGEAID